MYTDVVQILRGISSVALTLVLLVPLESLADKPVSDSNKSVAISTKSVPVDDKSVSVTDKSVLVTDGVGAVVDEQVPVSDKSMVDEDESMIDRGKSVVVADKFNEALRRLGFEIGNRKTAVAELYDGVTGNVTALSHLWGDRIEQGLRREGVEMVARLGRAIALEDIEINSSSTIVGDTSADVIIVGRYYIHPNQPPKGQDLIELHIKAVSSAGLQLVSAVSFTKTLGSDWRRLSLKVWHNTYHGAFEALPDLSSGTGPKLKAALNRDPACYPSGGEAVITIESEPQTYIYIYSIAADNTVTILYPNRISPNNLFLGSSFEFPSSELRKSGELALHLYPLDRADTQEAFKIVASREQLDFSFLPNPENHIFSGAEGGDIKKMLQVLSKAKDISQIQLPYMVGPGCSSQ